ncbi:MAG: cyclic nucleotide-binding domain-containing protein [Betaproteobacteria bacterium]|nr:cyclic nucleotide-binding domain-containing protein [Betaproteobacteria bacterium]
MRMEIVAWVASALVFASFFMRTIVPLRIAAIASNVAFITYSLLGMRYGIFAKVFPIFVLHGSLLPLNVYRLRQIKASSRHRKAGAETPTPSPEDTFGFVGERVEYAAQGQWLCLRGDPASALVQIRRGQVELVELRRKLAPGQFFGETAIFSETGRHPYSARCLDDCELCIMSAANVVTRFDHDAGFRHGIVRAMAAHVHDRASSEPINATATAHDAHFERTTPVAAGMTNNSAMLASGPHLAFARAEDPDHDVDEGQDERRCEGNQARAR